MSKRTETVDLVKPVFRVSARDLFTATIVRPGALVAYAAPVALAVAASFAIVVAAVSDHLVYANYLPQPIDVPSATSLTLVLTLVPFLLTVHLFAAASANLIVTARLLARDSGVISAWRHSARLLGRTIPAAIPALLVAAGAVFACSLVPDGEAAPWIRAAILIVLLVAFFPMLYVFAIATLKPLRARTAWREIRMMGKAVNDAGMLARIPLVISLGFGVGTAVGVLALARIAPVSLMNTVFFGTALVLVVSLTVVRAIGVVARLTLEGLSRQPEPHTIELPKETKGSTGRAAAAWLSAVAAVLVPSAALAGAIAINPTNLTTASVLDMGYVDKALQTIDLGAGDIASLSNSLTNYQFGLCVDQTCHGAHRAEWYGYGNALSANPAGGALAARWALDDDSEGQIWTLEVGDFSAAQLLAAKLVSEQHFRHPSVELIPENLRVIDTVTADDADPFSDSFAEFSTDLVINTSGEYPVIASLNSRESGEELLTLYRCADAKCSSATKQSTTANWEGITDALAPLDVAVALDGTVYMTLSSFKQTEDSPESDDTALIIAAPGEEMTITRIVEKAVDPTRDRDDLAGSQIVLNAEGLPIVLTRLDDSGTFQLLTCADAVCAEHSTQTLPGFESAEFRPAITVDATGRPLIATYSKNGKSVILLSCIDSACSSFESRIVAPASRIAPPLAIAIGRDGLPMITISNVWIHEINTFLPDPARIVLCQQPRCGAK